jgi:hypothetical protein
MFCTFVPYNKKSLKIPKGKSEAVNRRTANTMAKRQRKKEKQSITQKTKNQVACTPLKTEGELS